MALRYICLFSARPGINDPAKPGSHRSQAALIYHYSALIGQISTSLPVRQAGGEMSRDKQANSQIQSGERGDMRKGRRKEERAGEGKKKKNKDKDTRRMSEMKER